MALKRPSPARALLHPRTFCVLPPSRPGVRARGARRLAKGQVDVALVRDHRQLKKADKRASAAVTGLWTKELRAGIVCAGEPRRTGLCVVTRASRLATEVLSATHELGLGVEAAVSFPSDSTVADFLRSLPASMRFLVALHGEVPVTLLTAMAELGDRLQLWLVGPTASTQPPDLPANQVAKALGVAVAGSARELAAMALLRARKTRIKGDGLRIVSASDEETALAGDLLSRIDLRPARVAFPRLVLKDRATLRLSRRSKAIPATRETLEALAALAHLPTPSRGKRPKLRWKQATKLLDRWYRELHELQLYQLLHCFGIKTPPSTLTTSASGAAEATARIGLPVAVKAMGPTFHHRQEAGAVRLNVASVARARQAFRDVLLACSQLRPRPTLEGVLVQAMAPTANTLQCLLRWTTAGPLLWVRAGGQETVRSCPLSLDSARELANQIAPSSPQAVGTFLHRLTWLGEMLSHRMCWLWLDAVSVPGGRKAPLVIDARGEQTESLRNPLG